VRALWDELNNKYDYDIGRFTSTDVLFEKYYGWSPYQYSANYPLYYSLSFGEGRGEVETVKYLFQLS
jgi:hypothetical protein